MKIPPRLPTLLVVTLLATFCSVVAIEAQSFPSDAEVQALLQARVDAGGAVGIAVGLLEADGTTRTFTAGSAGMDVAPLSATTLFEIGSITKVFTGILLADMARRGEVALDAPVQDYLPAGVTMPTGAGEPITLEDLATHRSGLPRLPNNMAPADMGDPYVDYDEERLYAFLSSYTLPREVGAQVEYSNLGAGLLGHVLALRLGTTYEDAVKERILDPLGMAHSGITLTPAMAEAMARGHDPGGDEVPFWNVGTLAGAGGLRSDVADMLRFLAAQVGEPRSDLEAAMREAHRPRVAMGPGMEVGLHWITRTVGDGRIVWHNGGTGGFRTFAGFDPEAGTGVVVLTNSALGADDIGFHLLKPELPLAPPPVPAFATREEVAVDLGVLERYVGEYRLGPGLVATFTMRDGRLRTQLTGQPSFAVHAASDTVFFLRAVEAEIEFQFDESGAVTGMLLRQNGREVEAQRVR